MLNQISVARPPKDYVATVSEDSIMTIFYVKEVQVSSANLGGKLVVLTFSILASINSRKNILL